MTILLINKWKFYFVILFLLSCSNPVVAQDLTNSPINLFKEINYAIITGQENISDSLLIELSLELNSQEKNKQLQQLLWVYKGLHYSYFHYDYLLDSLILVEDKSDNVFISHWQRPIESEHSFNNADWERTIDLSMEFATEENSLDEKNFSPLFYAISLSNIIISRNNLLIHIDSLVSSQYSLALNILFKNSIDSLNNGILIKLYWASSVLNLYSNESKKLKEVLWKKLPALSIEDLTYFESILSTYIIDNHSFYEKRNNVSLYDGLTQKIILSNKSYFIRNRWFQHLLNFGMYGDNENEKEYFDIDLKYNKDQKNVSPYFVGQRLIHYGIYYANKNQSIASSFFNKFYEYLSGDSIFRQYNYGFYKYVQFDDYIYGGLDVENRFLIPFIENQNLINKNNSKELNFEYIASYINELLINRQFKKIDSLLKYDILISIYRSNILNIPDFTFFKAYEKIQDSLSLSNYFKLKSEFVNYENNPKNSYIANNVPEHIDNTIIPESIVITIPDIIEYATYFDDLSFADSLLNIYELRGIKAIQNFDIERLRKTDLSNLIQGYYVESSYITLYNKTHNNSYLLRLVKFRLLKDNLVKYIFSFNHSNDNAIDSFQRLLLKDDAIKSFKYTTNTFDYTSDFNYFENRKTKYNLLIDSLLSNSSILDLAILDSSKLYIGFLNYLNNNSIVLLGLASRKNPMDTVLSTYILLIEHDSDKLRLIKIEDSIFNTAIGNYFAITLSPYSKKDKFKYLLNNLRKSPSIGLIKQSCEYKNEIIIAGGALIDQIPFNVVLSDNNKTKKIYQLSNLAELNTIKKPKIDSNNNKIFQKNNILCLGGVNFNTEYSSLTRNLLII
jgi:hypothetical protein